MATSPVTFRSGGAMRVGRRGLCALRSGLVAGLCAAVLPQASHAGIPWHVPAGGAPELERALEALWDDHPFEITVEANTTPGLAGEGVWYIDGELVLRRHGSERRQPLAADASLQVTVARSWMFEAPVVDGGWVPPLPSPSTAPAPVEPIAAPTYGGIPLEVSLGFGARPRHSSFSVRGSVAVFPFRLTTGTEIGLGIHGSGLEVSFGPRQPVDVSSFMVGPVVSHPTSLGAQTQVDVRVSLGLRGLRLSPAPDKSTPGIRFGPTLASAVHLWSDIGPASGLRWGPHVRLEADLNRTLTHTNHAGEAQFLHPVTVHIGAGMRFGGVP